MSTHGCFSPSFPPFPSTWLSQPDAGAQEPDATVDDESYTGGAYYYVHPADDDQEYLGGSQEGGLRLFRSVSQFVLAFLRQTCLTYVCTQILLLPLTRLCRALVFEPSRPLACNMMLV